MDELAKLIDALAKLVGAIVWPGFAIFVIWRLGPSLKIFLENLSEASFKGLGIEATAKRRDVITAVVNAQISKSEAKGTNLQNSTTLGRIGSFISNANTLFTNTVLRRLRDKHVLWVDDNPDNNYWEQSALQALGVHVTSVLSSESAMETLKNFKGDFDLIISDMMRGDDKTAGQDLLAKIRKSGRTTPFIIYTGNSTPDQERVAINNGATGQASDPEKLISIVTKALSNLSAK